VSFSTTDKPKGQSLDGEALDVSLLDSRVRVWKESLGLYHQTDFPPKNFPVNEMGEKFHDRSHILIQDYLGRTSEEFRLVYNEDSNPSIYEEVLTYFCAKITHKPEESLDKKITVDVLTDDFGFLKHIGYVKPDSVFETKKEEVAHDMSSFLKSVVSSEDFKLFHQTLLFATRDCPGWDELGS
jgi:hypothetical protein